MITFGMMVGGLDPSPPSHLARNTTLPPHLWTMHMPSSHCWTTKYGMVSTNSKHKSTRRERLRHAFSPGNQVVNSMLDSDLRTYKTWKFSNKTYSLCYFIAFEKLNMCFIVTIWVKKIFSTCPRHVLVEIMGYSSQFALLAIANFIRKSTVLTLL